MRLGKQSVNEDCPKEHSDCQGEDGAATGTSGDRVEGTEDGIHGVSVWDT